MTNEFRYWHKNLDVWQPSIDLVSDVYKRVYRFPSSEKFGLISQMQRCAVSIPANIAEGAARQTKKERLQFLYVARGSLSELDTYVDICVNLGYFSKEDFDGIHSRLDQTSQLINGLIRHLQKK